MLLGQELFVLKIADEITTTQLMADAQEHPLFPQLEHVGAGDILVSSDPELLLVKFRMEQLADVVPILKVFGLHDHGRFFSADPVHSIVDAVVDPDIGVKVTHIRHQLAVLITRRHLMRLAPLVQVVVEGIGNPVPLGSFAMINHGGPTIFGDKTRTAEHTVPRGRGSQDGGVPFPVHHVVTGNMGKDITGKVPVDIVQMVAPLPEEGRIGIQGEFRHGVSQVIG